MTGQPRAVVTSSGATGAMNHAGTGTPAARNSRLARSLSIASALARGPLPVYGTPITSNTAWSVPPSSAPPCTARKSTSASRTEGSSASPSESICLSRSARASTAGGVRPTAPPSTSRSPRSSSCPPAVSTTFTSCLRLRSAATICDALAKATARSAVAPPVSTVTRINEFPPAGAADRSASRSRRPCRPAAPMPRAWCATAGS